ncbi:MAG: hypothetical protein D6820_02665 [Lentisphaerae bacterium]|nr:MAG: hypothetical protein D6820_02665 [Lentisphaerota bacterium]
MGMCLMTSHGRNHSFTLIELLVVITILMILAALLLPALGRARAKAKSTLCVAQNKEIAHGFTLYSSDFDGYLPAYKSDTSWPPKKVFYTNALHKAGAILVDKWNNENWGMTSSGIWLCPGVNDPTYYQQGGTEVYAGGGYGVETSHVIRIAKYHRMSDFTRPNEVWLIGDTWTNGANTAAHDPDHMYTNYAFLCGVTGSYHPDWLHIPYPAQPAPRHLERVNNAFIDGHVETNKWSFFYDNPNVFAHNGL